MKWRWPMSHLQRVRDAFHSLNNSMMMLQASVRAAEKARAQERDAAVNLAESARGFMELLEKKKHEPSA